jgi:hypothetical protein
MPYELVVPEPLGKVFQYCETVCLAGCCQLEAYDVKAESLGRLGQLLPDDIVVAEQQLDDLIAKVGVLGEAVASDPHFCYTWPTGAACAVYLGQWRQALLSARSVPVRDTDPQRRLARAGERNSESWQREVTHLVGDAHVFLTFGYHERGIALMRMIVALDDGEQSPLRMHFDMTRDHLARLG